MTDVPDDFDDDDDPGITPLPGGVEMPSGGIAEASDMLLDLICAGTKMRWLLKEADEAEHHVVAERLAELKRVVASLPDVGRPAKRVGFKVGTKPRRAKR